MNLISNAYKFTSEGGITIGIREEAVVQQFTRSKRLMFTVTDTGVGIPISERDQLFKMFGMVNQHRSKFNMKGTGLGLTIAQKL